MVIYTKQKFNGFLPLTIKHLEGKKDLYPENRLSLVDQLVYKSDLEVVVTNSPFIVAGYRKEQVKLFNNGEFLPVDFETLGADPLVIAKRLNSVDSLQNREVVETIRTLLKQSDQRAIEYIETLGMSAEKSYLLKKLACK